MKIRKSTDLDQSSIENIHVQAFGEEKGPEIAALVMGLFGDKTAMPILSLVAIENDKLIGHVLFTRVSIAGEADSIFAQILAPLAILPEWQKKGVGGKLIKEGLTQLKALGVALVFVLGHPDYYPQSGFKPAGVLGYEAPYPIPQENAGAWMVQELRSGVIGNSSGMVQCCDVLNQPEHWRE